jgi:AcrR family transcriptional regulator
LIVSTAVAIANRNGLIAATPAAVARACSIPTAKETVHYHFRTRDDLWRAVVAAKDALPHVREQGRSIGIETAAAV